jgi:hypothetical protein
MASRHSGSGEIDDRDVIRELFAEMDPISTGETLAEPPIEKCNVLEAIEGTDSFQTRPVSILCPGCSTIIKRYPTGLPNRIAHFGERCPDCEIALHRWSVIGVNSAYEEIFTPSQLQEVTTAYWNRHLWDGIVSGENNPRTEEFTEAYRNQAAAFGWEWDMTCPLCRRSLSALDVNRLDYHHWRRDPDQGVCLCRSCHEAINGGSRDRECDWKAQELGLKNKYDLQITRLAVREQAVDPHHEIGELADSITERYNLIHSPPEVSHLLSQTLHSDAVVAEISDQYLFVGLPDPIL